MNLLQRIVRVDSLLQTLMMSDVNGFPVFERSQFGEEFLGIILRSQLMTLLQHPRCFQKAPGPAQPEVYAYLATDLARDVREVKVSDLELSEEQHQSFLDLGPICNPSTYVIQEGASLSKVYAQFRQLELRHMVVIPKVASISGILTRKDLLPGMLEKRFPEMAAGMLRPSGSGGLSKRESREPPTPTTSTGPARKAASAHFRKHSLAL
jgi:Mg2+/Co2+ transporter CorC